MLFYQLLITSIQRKMQFKSIRSFIGAKNFDTSKEFYKELGFIEVSLGEKMSYFRIDNNLGFYLQYYYTKKWINNSMLFLEVDDLQSYLQEMKAKNLPSKLFNFAARKTSGVQLNDFNCGLKAYRNEVIKNIEVTGEMHRYIPVLAKNAGFSNIGEKIVKHQARKYGETKFGMELIRNFLAL